MEQKKSGNAASSSSTAAPQVDPDIKEIIKEPVDASELQVSAESLQAKARGIPVMPNLEERALRRLTHLPFRV